MRVLLVGAALCALAACSPAVPDSGQGVGFDRVDQERTARLERDRRLQAAPPVSTATLDPDASGQETESARQARLANSGQAPLQASPDNPAPQAVTDGAGLSREQDFQAVSGERDIQDDAERLRQAQSQYRIIEPTALPTRAGSDRPNVVAYALQTNNPVGTAIHKRGRTSEAKHQRNCAAYASPDLAQEDFLALGGPAKDRKGLDPDGDGFACSWDPTPFRRVAGG